ncbi:single-stranded DNA-binding protein 4 isoform X2 [Sorex araneus]|uniref:single-stranded DNA-binding protein 4 isoform X2 n=1 Tax=Sorex araneus TaxID=42254 RepID=UPI002433A156|nr:single-stranded DNA-binding protein 4 isoform X2 [Sorex araneus]
MYAKGSKGSAVPSDSQAREKLALYVYEYLLHMGAQKSAQTFLSEIRWEKNIMLGEPPGFLHSWWCVFWDLYCMAPDCREACAPSSEPKAFPDFSPAAGPKPMVGGLVPGDVMAAGPLAPGFFQPFMSSRFPGGPWPTLRMPSQPPVGLPGPQPLLPSSMDPSRAQESASTPGHGWPWAAGKGRPGSGGLGSLLLAPVMPFSPSQSYGGGLRPPPHAVSGPALPPSSMSPVGRGPWTSPGDNSGPPGAGRPSGTPILPSPGDSSASSENTYTVMNPVSASRANFPLGPAPEDPLMALSALEAHHANGSLGSGDMDGLPKNSLGSVAGLSNALGTPRDDGEMAPAGTFLHSFPSESLSPGMTVSV